MTGISASERETSKNSSRVTEDGTAGATGSCVAGFGVSRKAGGMGAGLGVFGPMAAGERVAAPRVCEVCERVVTLALSVERAEGAEQWQHSLPVDSSERVSSRQSWEVEEPLDLMRGLESVKRFEWVAMLGRRQRQEAQDDGPARQMVVARLK